MSKETGKTRDIREKRGIFIDFKYDMELENRNYEQQWQEERIPGPCDRRTKEIFNWMLPNCKTNRRRIEETALNDPSTVLG